MKNFIVKYKSFLVKTAIVALFIVLAGICVNVFERYMGELRLMNYPLEVMQHEAKLSYSENKSKLVREVKHYIDSVAPTSSLNAYAVVECCEKYDLDIKFVLAQGQLESHFGTTGLAVKTNSVFNVGAYDRLTVEQINGRYKYRHPDHSIEPYMKLLYRDYIRGDKTELDLMAKYVNKYGQRYSSNQNYENDMLSVYRKIDKTTSISYLQGEMRRYKIICGI